MSTNISQHLTSAIDNNTPVDPKIIDAFRPQDQTDLLLIVGPANHIVFSAPDLDPTRVVPKLLERVLAAVLFTEVLGIFPPQFVNDNLSNIASEPETSVAILKLVLEKIDDPTCVQFLKDNNVANNVTEQYLTITDLPVIVVSQVELFLRYYLGAKAGPAPMLDGLNAINADSTVRSRFLAYTLILADFNLFVSPDKYYFDKRQLENLAEDDPLFAILLVQFCGDIFVRNLLVPAKHWEMLDTLYLAGQMSFVGPEVANLVVKISGDPKFDNWCQKALKDTSLFPEDLVLRILAHANPKVLTNVLLDYPLLSSKYFAILLNIISDENLFKQHLEYFTSARLGRLTADMLFALLLVMSQHSFTQSYLFENLPQVLSNFLSERDVTNPQLFGIKMDVIKNLLESSETSREPWKPQLTSSLHRMQNGDGVPHVDVMSTTR